MKCEINDKEVIIENSYSNLSFNSNSFDEHPFIDNFKRVLKSNFILKAEMAQELKNIGLSDQAIQKLLNLESTGARKMLRNDKSKKLRRSK